MRLSYEFRLNIKGHINRKVGVLQEFLIDVAELIGSQSDSFRLTCTQQQQIAQQVSDGKSLFPLVDKETGGHYRRQDPRMS